MTITLSHALYLRLLSHLGLVHGACEALGMQGARPLTDSQLTAIREMREMRERTDALMRELAEPPADG